MSSRTAEDIRYILNQPPNRTREFVDDLVDWFEREAKHGRRETFIFSIAEDLTWGDVETELRSRGFTTELIHEIANEQHMRISV